MCITFLACLTCAACNENDLTDDYEPFDVEFHDPPCEVPYSLLSFILKLVERQYCGVCTPPDARDESQDRKRHEIVTRHVEGLGW
jgi:hypothetical protein